jgi:GT2 family glycosyltransferase
VILLSVDEAPMLEHSLAAVLAQEPKPDVVVVDNASSDETAETVARHGVRHLRLDQRVSYARAINRGIACTESDAVLLLNADCFVQPGFLAAALPRLAEPGVGSVAPRLIRALGPGRQLQELDAAGMFIDHRRKNGLTGFGEPASAFGQACEVFGADGAAALYRRQTLEDCALGEEVLDEDMALWASDADLAWRAQLAGWRCVYEPAAVAHHIRTYSPSTRAQMSEEARRIQFRNRYLMMVKNETRASFWRDAPVILGFEILALGHVLLRERHLLRGYREAWQLLPAARRRRAQLKERWRHARVPFGLRAAA